MKDRITRLMNAEGLSSSRLADEIGVQRSSVSHLLSGRNNPSYEFIQKLLTRFPRLNAEWIILGTGPMYKEVRQTDLFQPLPDTEEAPFSADSVQKTPVNVPPQVNGKALTNTGTEDQAEPGETVHEKDSKVTSYKNEEPVQLIIVYRDGTFQNFRSSGT